MQTFQIDKLGTAPFDGTTLINADTIGINVQTISSESRTILTIPSTLGAGLVDIRSFFPSLESRTIVGFWCAITGDFAGNFTGGFFGVRGPAAPGGARTTGPVPLTGTPGFLPVGGPLTVDMLLFIVTDPADTGPYRLICNIEDRPTQFLRAAIGSGQLSV